MHVLSFTPIETKTEKVLLGGEGKNRKLDIYGISWAYLVLFFRDSGLCMKSFADSRSKYSSDRQKPFSAVKNTAVLQYNYSAEIQKSYFLLEAETAATAKDERKFSLLLLFRTNGRGGGREGGAF